MSEWNKSSWQNFTALQQPNWPDQNEYQNAVDTISKLPPLVFAGEIRTLKKHLADCVEGRAFLLQVVIVPRNLITVQHPESGKPSKLFCRWLLFSVMPAASL